MKTPDGTIDIFLQPGDVYFGDASTLIRTLLGSCVSITLWHPVLLIGGMCHYMLPSRARKTGPLNGRYADEAMALFLLDVARHNTVPEEYQVKLFGGGSMFPERHIKPGVADVALRNVEAAHSLVAKHNLNLMAQDLGLTGHRAVNFDIQSGHAWVRHQQLKQG